MHLHGKKVLKMVSDPLYLIKLTVVEYESRTVMGLAFKGKLTSLQIKGYTPMSKNVHPKVA
jgi:hypothetical protein